mgnify:CR=1 FL=1
MSYERANEGAADWATIDELSAAGMTDSSQHGFIFLGEEFRSKYVFGSAGEEHILTLAPPGTGKTAAVVIPSLLTNHGSIVALDPKGALTAQTARFRRSLGQTVVVLNPWCAEIAKDLGQDLGDTSFNPLSILDRDDPSLTDNAKLLSVMICPTRHDANPTEKYFTKTAATIISRVLVWLTLQSPEPPTLPQLFSMCRQAPDGWRDLAEKMNEAGLTDYANEILDPIESEKQWAGITGTMQEVTEIYEPGTNLGKHVSRSEFNLRDLKEKDITVYIVIPSRHRKANREWLSLVMALCAEMVGTPGPSKRVTLIAEEFANIGYMPTITNALAEYREMGLRAHLIIQTAEHVHTLYGRTEATALFKLCGIRQFFGIDDISEAQRIEKALGTFPAPSAQGTGFVAVPLMRAQDILNMPKGMQIVLVRGSVRPILGYLRPYYTIPGFIEITDPNPYRPTGDHRVQPMVYEIPLQEIEPKLLAEKMTDDSIYFGIALFVFWIIIQFVAPDFDIGPILFMGGVLFFIFELFRAAFKNETKWRDRRQAYEDQVTVIREQSPQSPLSHN